jgi:protein O-GlcNAc transferase
VVPLGAERDYREKVLRLPDSYVCYDPPADAPAVGPLPALARGHVTFGSLNNPAKITPQVVAVWAEILRRVPTARLVLRYHGLDDAETARRYVAAFAGAGVDPGRVDISGWAAHAQRLDLYNQIDLGLDPFPYSGATTTCDALWMGVPVVTLPGETFDSRQSLAHVMTVGLEELVACDPSDYVARAVALAGDLPCLAALRGGLRGRMADSPLCDGPRFAADFMALLREAWRRWAVSLA